MDDATKLLFEEILDGIKDVKKMLKAQNGRVRKLEQWRSAVVGVLTFLVIAVPIVIKLFL